MDNIVIRWDDIAKVAEDMTNELSEAYEPEVIREALWITLHIHVMEAVDDLAWLLHNKWCPSFTRQLEHAEHRRAGTPPSSNGAS